jgi:hypothetical protein
MILQPNTDSALFQQPMTKPRKSPASAWIVASTTQSAPREKLNRKAGAPWIVPDAAVVAKVAAVVARPRDVANAVTPENAGITLASRHPLQIERKPNPYSTQEPAGERRARNSHDRNSTKNDVHLPRQLR